MDTDQDVERAARTLAETAGSPVRGGDAPGTALHAALTEGRVLVEA